MESTLTRPAHALCARALATAAALASVSALGCGAPFPQPAEQRPNYYEDVRPILSAHCLDCHHGSGSVTEMAKLSSDDEARAVASSIAHTVREHSMPLWGVDNGGECNTWRNARWLEPEESRILEEWAELGAPEGDRAKAAPDITSP